MPKEKIKKIIFHPLTLAVTIFLLVHIFNISRFDFLAEKDSYGWLLKYEDNLRYDTINDYRQLFSSLLISIHHLTGLELFDIFKYLMPFSFLIAFIPLWLVARNLKNKFSQFLILLAPLGSATLILQMEGTRPQIMAMFFLYFSLGLAMLAKKEGNQNFAMVAVGFLALTGSLFHRVFVIFFLIWVIALIYNYWRIFLQNKVRFLVLAVLAIPWLEKLEAKNMVLMALGSLKEIFGKIFIHPQFNFQFPAHYVNIDGIQMGWNNLAGVAKYYAFYAGPFWIFLIFLIAVLLIFSSKFRKFIKNILMKKEFVFVYLLILFFLFIAEFLPRIGSIAYLPDRAWVFLGILLILPLYFLLDYLEKEMPAKISVNFICVMSVFLAVSIFGGIYVKSSMKNIVPNYKMDSFEWIKNNIESESLLFSAGYTSALKYHSGMDVLPMKKDVFESGGISKLVSILNMGDKVQFDRALYKTNLNQLMKKADSIKNILTKEEFSYIDLSKETKNIIGEAKNLISQINSSTIFDLNKPVYIYFAKDSQDNPYKVRVDSTGGYYSGIDNDDIDLLYRHPEYFEKVYDTGNVMIWKFLKEKDNEYQ